MSPSQETIEIKKREVFLHYAASEETLIESVTFKTQAETVLWLRPFPTQPEVTEIQTPFFSELEVRTRTPPPYNRLIRKKLFGPSILTPLLSDRLEPKIKHPPAPPNIPGPTGEVERIDFFVGPARSSTITQVITFPEAFTQWLETHQRDLSNPQQRELASYFNRGWTLMAVEISAPRADVEWTVGPLRFDFENTGAIFPTLRRNFEASDVANCDFYVLAHQPLISSQHVTWWKSRPWETFEPLPEQFVVLLSHPNAQAHRAGRFLIENLGLAPNAPLHLLRSRYNQKGPEGANPSAFFPARSSEIVPGALQRGTWRDILLCILLGLAPLFYTPEAWLLLWWGQRARAQIRQRRAAIGTHFWAIYAVVVGAFWLIIPPGGGRWAALLPLSIGTIQMLLPYRERNTTPVRSRFAKRRDETEKLPAK